MSRLTELMFELSAEVSELSEQSSKLFAMADGLDATNYAVKDLIAALDLNTSCYAFPGTTLKRGRAPEVVVAAPEVAASSENARGNGRHSKARSQGKAGGPPRRSGARAKSGNGKKVRRKRGAALRVSLDNVTLPKKYERDQQHRDTLVQVLKLVEGAGDDGVTIREVVAEVETTVFQAKEYLNMLVKVNKLERSKGPRGFVFKMVKRQPLARRTKRH